MAVHKLILDDVFDDISYSLIAIHCTLEDYRLAYLINKYLKTRLARRSKDLDFDNGQSAYSIFEWEDEKQLTTWSLVSNTCKTESFQQATFESLFENQEKITRITHLIPEYKRVNYFLKIENEFSLSKEKYILDSILEIPQIATAYSVDANDLKSKDNLIFS
ncbi:IPExxxVDY family protein [Algibacter miyuki]|uniref:IPExxxVDY family protein n=1 Tax=Algibacter miyuki TaxID=1306933 RepID=A0ABV5GVE3_9FLAO|nr:IPExxxVDY family protein [Algibacter miyuki]MDN3664808.1 IPExxxVDY family protein [Algibacter miyuki]